MSVSKILDSRGQQRNNATPVLKVMECPLHYLFEQEYFSNNGKDLYCTRLQFMSSFVKILSILNTTQISVWELNSHRKQWLWVKFKHRKSSLETCFYGLTSKPSRNNDNLRHLLDITPRLELVYVRSAVAPHFH